MNKKHLHLLSAYLALIVIFSVLLNSMTAFASTLDSLQKYSTNNDSSTYWFSKTDDQSEYSILKGKSFTSWLSGSKNNPYLKATSIYVPERCKKYIDVKFDKNNGNFTVKGLAKGIGNFVVYSKKQPVYITVTVNEIHANFISITPTEYPNGSTSGSLILRKGNISMLKATLSPSNSTDTIIWSSSNNAVATVSSSGIVKALETGKTTIFAVTESGKVAKYNIQVIAPTTTTIRAPTTTTTRAPTTTTTRATTTTKKLTTTTKKLTTTTTVRPTTTTKATLKQVKILASALNVRTGKSKSYAVITVVHKGDVYTYTKCENGWYYIKVGNIYGWAYANGGSYIQKLS